MQSAVNPKPVAAILATVLLSVGADVAPVFDQAGFRVRLLPEKLEIGLFQILQKLIVLSREGRR